MRSGKRGCVVYAVAGHSDPATLALQLLDLAMFVLGRDVRFDFVDTDLACYRTRGGFAVAGKHHDLDAALMQRGNSGAAGFLDRIGDSDKACRCPVHGHEHHRLSEASAFVRR